MPVEMIVVDVPTAVCNKTVGEESQGGTLSQKQNQFCGSPCGEDLPQPECEGTNVDREQAQARQNRAVAAAADAGGSSLMTDKLPSSPLLSSHSDHIVPLRTCNANVAGPARWKSENCLMMPQLSHRALLDFSGKQLTALPCVHDMTAQSRHGRGNPKMAQVNLLQLSRNNITSLLATSNALMGTQSVALADFGKVVVLDVSRNEITSLAGVEEMRSLRVLHASHNKLEDLGPLFTPSSVLQRSGTLRVLDVSFNKIRAFLPSSADAAERPSLRSVHTLTLSYNHLKQLDGLDTLFPYVVEVRVVRNQIAVPPQMLPKKLSCLQLQQNYLDQTSQKRLRELQQRIQSLREVNMSEQRVKQKDAHEICINIECEEESHGSETEEGEEKDENDVCGHDATEVVFSCSVDGDQNENACDEMELQEIINQPSVHYDPMSETSVVPLGLASQKSPEEWIQGKNPEVMALLTHAAASKSLQYSQEILSSGPRPQIIETQSTEKCSPVREAFPVGAEGPLRTLSLGNTNGIAAGCCNDLSLASMAAKAIVSMKTEEEEDKNEKEKVLGRKNTAVLQQQQLQPYKEDHPTETFMRCHTTLPLYTMKKNPFTRGVSGREWLLDELRAPLMWSETNQSCSSPFSRYLMHHTKQERIDRRRKAPDACSTLQRKKVVSGSTVL